MNYTTALHFTNPVHELELAALRGLGLVLQQIGVNWGVNEWELLYTELELGKPIENRHLWISAGSEALLANKPKLEGVEFTPQMLSHALRQLGQYQELVKHMSATKDSKVVSADIMKIVLRAT